MTQLKDLLKTIPTQVLQVQEQLSQEHDRSERQRVMREVARRKALSYQHRMEALEREFHPFDECQQRRPSKRKVQNRYSAEEAGTRGAITMGVRTGSYNVCVCKVKQNY